MTATSWRPLLDGALADRASGALADLAGALTGTDVRGGLHPRARPVYAASLSSGAAGRALFYAYLALAAGEEAGEAWADHAERLLDEAAETVATSPLAAGLYSGFTGPAWVAAHFEGRLFEAEDGEDLNGEIDAALLDRLAKSPWRDHYDLISGLVGLGVYALERLPRPSAVRCLEAIVARLAESAEQAESIEPPGVGLTWHTPVDLLPAFARERTPGGYYNLGVAHGVPGVVGLLARACLAGVAEERARPLLEGAVTWVLSEDVERGGRRRYPVAVGPGIEAQPTRLAWCYGDPGVAAALLAAARAADRSDWEAAALGIARRAAATPPAESGAVDPGLCHGAFGLAHLYNRMHQATGATHLGETARRWYEIGLDMRSTERGIAGFSSWDFQVGTEPEWVDDPGFLTGAAGVGLALLAATTEIAPEWDRVLLLDLPPRL